MHNYNQSQPPLTPGTSLFGAGGALLVLCFFLPWFSACNIAISGKDLAFGIDTGFGTSTAGTYPWLAFVPVAGLVAVGLAFFNWNQPLQVVQRRALVGIGTAGAALGLLLIVGIGFIRAVNDSTNTIVNASIEFGFYASFLVASAMLGGALLDLRGQSWGVRPTLSAMPNAAPYTQPRASPLPLPAPSAWLQGRSGEYAGSQISITSDNWVIGRSANSQLHLSDTTVSRTHALIRVAQGRYFLQDQGSQAGTQINGQAITAQMLNDGDVVTIGDNTFIFRIRN